MERNELRCPASPFKLLVEHREGCWTEGDEYRFIVADGIEWNRRTNGSKGGSTSWTRYRCNDPHCPAIALVRWDALAAFVTAGIEGDADF